VDTPAARRPVATEVLGLDVAPAVVDAEEVDAAAVVGEEVLLAGRVRIVRDLAAHEEHGLVGDALQLHVHRAAGGVALLVGREGLGHLDALDDRGRELVELDGALVLVGRGQAHAVQLRVDVAVGEATDHGRLAVLDRRARTRVAARSRRRSRRRGSSARR
jgi:hypothetical protein